jgi:hypothetical protein
VRPHEVHARAERDRRDLRLRAGAQDAVRDLVQRPVSAGGDEQVGAVARRTLRQLDQVARPLGEERLALEPEL